MAADTLPHYEHLVFPQPPLELCLAQLRYPPLPRFGDQSFLMPIREALSEEYPLASTEQSRNVLITLAGVREAAGTDLLRFASIDGAWAVVLAQDSVTLETRAYHDIKEFERRFGAVLAILSRCSPLRYQTRFGLRYVNEFRHPSGRTYQGWRSLLPPALLTGIPLEGTVEHAISEVRAGRPDGVVLVRHGFLSGTTVQPRPPQSPKNGPFYLLDLDYADERTLAFDRGVVDRLPTYNNFLYRLFRWTVGDGPLFEHLMGGVP